MPFENKDKLITKERGQEELLRDAIINYEACQAKTNLACTSIIPKSESAHISSSGDNC